MLKQLNPQNWDIAWESAAYAAILLVIAVAIGWAFYRLLFFITARITRISANDIDDMLVDRLRSPVKWSFIALGITVFAQSNTVLAAMWEPLAQFLRPALMGWIAYTIVKAITTALDLRLASAADPVTIRSRRTRIAILSRTATLAVIIVTIGLMMLGIPGVRTIGTTMLASAGLAALAVGAAAQPALKSLIAGLQMAITEPLRIGDLVVVDGHTGRVEEIRMSYVIVRVWDQRAVIVPTVRFLDESFENWSRKDEMLTGPVFLHLDPATEVGPIRAEFERFIATQDVWDQRTASLLMTEAHPESIELRLAMSARTIGDLFQLRCHVREHMVGWLRMNMPDALIRHRLEVEGANARAAQS